ncbi:MAG TPA: Zn-dependent hydrolase [Phycisphaerae bacterium]|nr:Zn-dependent hydrolase [Phycisphaerae bacterium]
MIIHADRIAADIEVIGACSECPVVDGHSRPTFSGAWGKARAYVVGELERAGCVVRVDAAGNLHGRQGGGGWGEKVFLSGSHLDSVPTGGKFDGVVGVAAPLEILRAAHEAGERVGLELVVFAEEEGTTFNLGMLGSRAWVGTLSGEELGGLKNKQGQSYLEAGAAFGVDPARLAGERFDPAGYRGFIEVHVEQGVGLWEANAPVALVTAINGRRQYAVTLTGDANHAGSTKMGHRRDALAAAAEMVGALEVLAHDLDRRQDHTVITVGRLMVEPNALNVIAGRVHFYIDLRARSDAMLSEGDRLIRAEVKRIAHRRRMGWAVEQTEELPAMAMDAALCGRLREAAERLGVVMPEAASGALHDAAILAPFLPTAMLFVASKDGVSHNPGEYSRIEEIAAATSILAEAVRA